MVVKILKDCMDAAGKEHKAGEVANVAKCIARGLIHHGLAEVACAVPSPPAVKKRKAKK